MRRPRDIALVFLTLLVASAVAPIAAADAGSLRFQPLGSVPGISGGSIGSGMSPDGSIVVGRTAGSHREAWRWTSAGGMQGLGFPAGETSSAAHVVTPDGGYIAGTAGANAFRWSSGGSFETIVVGVEGQHVGGISDDGATIVGSGNNYPTGFDNIAWRWRSGIGIDLSIVEDLVFDGWTTFADISADGETILEVSGYMDSSVVHLRTDAGREYISLYTVFHCQCPDFAKDMTPDASFIVGDYQTVEAFRWDAATDTTLLLGFLDFGGDYFESTALAVSDNGAVVVGFVKNEPAVEQAAFVWRRETGMLDLAQLLVDAGIDLTGWQLQRAVAISANGRTILGNGINPSGDPEAWLVEIPESLRQVPGLETWTLVILCGFLALTGMLVLRATVEPLRGTRRAL